MSNIATALSGLQNVSLAIDTVSNNIANANTVGYKSGEYIFATQFLNGRSSSDQSSTGQGTQTLGVRRPMTQGAITNSANSLDLAISGKGMFRLLQGSGSVELADPSAVYYSRNGQFGVEKRLHRERKWHVLNRLPTFIRRDSNNGRLDQEQRLAANARQQLAWL